MQLPWQVLLLGGARGVEKTSVSYRPAKHCVDGAGVVVACGVSGEVVSVGAVVDGVLVVAGVPVSAPSGLAFGLISALVVLRLSSRL